MSALLKHLPKEAAAIAAEQGWDDISIGIHLIGYMQNGLIEGCLGEVRPDTWAEMSEGLRDYFAMAQKEENVIEGNGNE